MWIPWQIPGPSEVPGFFFFSFLPIEYVPCEPYAKSRFFQPGKNALPPRHLPLLISQPPGHIHARQTNSFAQTSSSQKPGFRNSPVLRQSVCASDGESARPAAGKAEPFPGPGGPGGHTGGAWQLGRVSKDRMRRGTVLNK